VRIEVTEDDAGRRLDALVRRAAGLPQPLVMRLIRTGRVVVSGRKVRPDARVETGDVVEFEDVGLTPAPGRKGGPARESDRAGGRAGVEAAPAERGPRLSDEEIKRRILFEDKDLLVFDKPAGIVAHAGTGHGGGLVDLLAAYVAASSPGSDGKPALAQRLDRDTSGATVLAKTGLALRGLTASIRVGRLEKGYTALVHGTPALTEGVVDAALLKEAGIDGLERMRVVDAEAPGALAARTRWRLVRAIAGKHAALLDLTPETGRTHQIRVHCAHMGHRIAGDPRYGDRALDGILEREAGLRRLFLHASRLAFPHPRTGERLEVTAPLAQDLAQVLARLEGGAPG